MCINSKYVTNPYIGKRILVKCGKCAACKQEKAAASASRIRNASHTGFVPLLITLTYSNKFVPYVYKDDVNQYLIPVYRDNIMDRKFGRNKVVQCSDPVSYITNEYYLKDDFSSVDFRKGLKCLRHTYNRIGICLYKDVQDFFKRLRVYLFRNYGYTDKIDYWSCSEYGSKSLRPHFHILCYVRNDFIKNFRSSVIACWSFSDWNRPSKSIQVARNAASYVASYINRGADFPLLLENSLSKPRHSMSKGFGSDVDMFNLSSLLTKVKRGDLRYHLQSFRNGERVITSVLVPKYVINRYFPRFKGDYLISDDEIRELLLVPSKLRFLIYYRNRLVQWSYDDYHRFCVRINHAVELFASVLDISLEDAREIYPFFYSDVWRCYHSNVIKFSYDSITSVEDFSDFYENPNILFFNTYVSDLQYLDLNFTLDPNRRKDIVDKSFRMSLLYDSMSKYRDINNLAYSHQYDDF